MKINRNIKLGVIADDFTGAADAASFLVRSGMNPILYTSIPKWINDNCDCVVIALKIRSVDPQEAVKQTKEVIDFFIDMGIQQYYYKYCSTFDSTPKGNIGVVLDFLLDYLGESYTLLCPSLPVNGRTVKDGILYVNRVPLSDSPMRNHPLNPMWDSFIPTLMKDQSKYPCVVVTKQDFNEGKLSNKIKDQKETNKKFYLVPDFSTEDDGRSISENFRSLKLLSGGSGLLEYLWLKEKSAIEPTINQTGEHKKQIILCGSCSKMTHRQIDHFKSMGGLTYPVDSRKLLNGTVTSTDVFDYVLEHKSKVVLIYSDAIEKDMSILSKSPTFIEESKIVEQVMAELSLKALHHEYDRIIVAGGETSGAVTLKLGYDAFFIGTELAPGVPTLVPVEKANVQLILKSGNFGEEDFFQKTVESN